MSPIDFTEMSILHVEDDSLLNFLMKKLFLEMGFNTVASASTAAEALKLTDENLFDIAVLDINLGAGPTGADLSRIIREKLPEIGILFLTSYEDLRMSGIKSDAIVQNAMHFLKSEITHEKFLESALEATYFAARNKKAQITPIFKSERKLTDNQFELLRLLAAGYSNGEIAKRRHTEEKSTENAISRLAKLFNISDARETNQRVLLAREYWFLANHR